MNPESTPSDTLILQLVTLIKDTKDFAAAQLPDVVNQIIMQKWINTIFGLSVTLTLLLGFFLISRFLHHAHKDPNCTWDDDVCMAGSWVSAGASAFCVAPFLCFVHQAICLYYTPKLVVISALLKMVHN
jgi:hypothetical protein